jgi:hypothetical protein
VLTLQLSPAVLLSPGGLGAAAELAVGWRWLATHRLGLESLVVFPTFPARIEQPSGSADTWRGMLTIGPLLTSGAEARAALDLSVGAALALTHVSGTGSEGFVGQSENQVSAGPYARVGGSLALSRRWRLRSDVASGVVFPRPVVYFEDERIAAWGRPWFLLSLGLEVAL